MTKQQGEKLTIIGGYDTRASKWIKKMAKKLIKTGSYISYNKYKIK